MNVSYPIQLRGNDRWDGVQPTGSRPMPLYLPRKGQVTDSECYVPAGWTWLGGDIGAGDSLAGQRVWVDGFVIQKHPITNKQYIDFLVDLVDQGREDEALRYAPRERTGTLYKQSSIIYGRDGEGHFILRLDADGDVWAPDWPVIMVDWECAVAFAEWHARRCGVPWRLPCELEWEKAARGVDGRFYPWGDWFDPSFACLRASHRGKPSPAGVNDFAADESPYGVMGMAGNVREWCLDRDPQTGPEVENRRAVVPDTRSNPNFVSIDAEWSSMTKETLRVVRGGMWMGSAALARAAHRTLVAPSESNASIGFRLVRSFS